jgi:hypothetical protein
MFFNYETINKLLGGLGQIFKLGFRRSVRQAFSD